MTKQEAPTKATQLPLPGVPAALPNFLQPVVQAAQAQAQPLDGAPAEPDNIYPIAALTAAQIVRLAQILTTPASHLSDALVKAGAVHKADRGRLPGNEPDEPQEPELA